MKKLLCLALAVAVIVIGSLVYKRYRIPPLDEGSCRAIVLSAAIAECAKNWKWYGDHVIVLQADPNVLTVQVDEGEITVEEMRRIIPEVLRVRMDRSLFWVDNSAGDDNASLALEKELEQLPSVGRICIIDPKHPPAWYPPKPYYGPLSAIRKNGIYSWSGWRSKRWFAVSARLS